MMRCLCCTPCIFEREDFNTTTYDGEGSPTAFVANPPNYISVSGTSVLFGHNAGPGASPATNNGQNVNVQIYLTTAGDTVTLGFSAAGAVAAQITSTGTNGTVSLIDSGVGTVYGSTPVPGLAVGEWTTLCFRIKWVTSTTQDYEATATPLSTGAGSTIAIASGASGTPAAVPLNGSKFFFLVGTSTEVRFRKLIATVDVTKDSKCTGCVPFPRRIGYETASYGIESVLTLGPWEGVVNVFADISKLSQVEALFCGRYACEDKVYFDPSDWATIGSWVSNGGRLMYFTDHELCVGKAEEAIAFLSAVGSSLSYIGGDHNSIYPYCSSTYYSAGAAAVMSGKTCSGERFGEVSGGTTLLIGNAGAFESGAGLVAGTIELVGSGVIALIGDKNLMLCSGAGPLLDSFVQDPISGLV